MFRAYYRNNSSTDFLVTKETIDLANRYMDKRDHIKMEGLDPNAGDAIPLDEHTRKEISEDDCCPICLEDFGDEALVWCKSQCGNSVHKTCFMKWFQKKSEASCILCRASWVW